MFIRAINQPRIKVTPPFKCAEIGRVVVRHPRIGDDNNAGTTGRIERVGKKREGVGKK